MSQVQIRNPSTGEVFSVDAAKWAAGYHSGNGYVLVGPGPDVPSDQPGLASAAATAVALSATAAAVADEDSAVRAALDGLYGSAVQVAALNTGAVRVTFHGANVSAARPASAGPVMWLGSVQPANMVAGDFYAAVGTTPVVQAWTPASLTGLQGWYDPTSLALSNGASLTTWADKSSNSRTLTANGEAPVFSAAGLGGHPAVSFATGTVGTLDTAVFGASVSGPLAFFLNFTATDLSVIRQLIGGASSTDVGVMLRSTGAGYTIRRTSVDISVTSTVTTATPYSLAVVLNGASSSVYVNGTQVGTGTAGTDVLTKLRLGRGGSGLNRHAGLIGDVFWMTGVPDATALAQANAFLAVGRGG